LKRHPGWILFLLISVLLIGAFFGYLQLTAEYPSLGEAVHYPVNQLPGFELHLENLYRSPFKGHVLRYKATADTAEVYTLRQDGVDPDFEFLDRCIDGQWYRLQPSRELAFSPLEFALGGDAASALEGSLVQKYAYYGTHLEPGLYRLVLELWDADKTPHYLAAEFEIS